MRYFSYSHNNTGSLLPGKNESSRPKEKSPLCHGELLLCEPVHTVWGLSAAPRAPVNSTRFCSLWHKHKLFLYFFFPKMTHDYWQEGASTENAASSHKYLRAYLVRGCDKQQILWDQATLSKSMLDYVWHKGRELSSSSSSSSSSPQTLAEWYYVPGGSKYQLI